MATLAIPSSSAARSASRQPVEILPRQVPTVSISSAPSLASFHHDLPAPPVSPEFADFPDSVLDFEELVEVDELLTELGMTAPMSGYAEDDGAAVSEVSDDQYQEGLLPPFQTTATAPAPAAAAPSEAPAATETVKSTSPPGGVVRRVSMDQLAFASISGAVPNPMANIPMDDEPPTKKQKVYTPLLPNPTLSTTTAITTSATKMTKPVTTTTSSTKTTKKITTSKPKATIAKSSSIPSLLPSSILPSTAVRTTVVNPAVSNGRKRKLTRKEQELNMSAEELEERRERNRSHAKKSRQRKKAMTELLQESVQSLQQANQILRDGLNTALGNNYAEGCLQSREEQQKDAFLQALKNPANRVVDAAGLAFLKKLQKRIPQDNSMEAVDDEA